MNQSVRLGIGEWELWSEDDNLEGVLVLKRGDEKVHFMASEIKGFKVLLTQFISVCDEVSYAGL